MKFSSPWCFKLFNAFCSGWLKSEREHYRERKYFMNTQNKPKRKFILWIFTISIS